MADKFCDHGAYGECSFTGSISTTTLTVTAITSGVLGVGSHIFGTGVLLNQIIVSLGSGLGGLGTYNLQASNTLSTLAMTGKYAMPANIPITWGVPQEGDGTAATAATASATVAIDLSAATAAAGATFSVMGAVLTCVASGATAAQFDAGAGAALVASLVAAINRVTNTSTVAAQATGWATPKVQNAVYARVGSPTTTLNIMTRAGSATYNASTVATSGFTGGTFGPYTFGGGSGGCWGHLINTVQTMWPSALAAGSYGVWGVVTSAPLAGTAVAGSTVDRVVVRANKRIVCNTSFSLGFSAWAGSLTTALVHEIDDSTVWTGDGANPVLEWVGTVNGSGWVTVGNGYTSNVIIKGRRYSNGTHSHKMSSLVFGNATTINVGFGFSLWGFETSMSNASTRFTCIGSTKEMCYFVDCKIGVNITFFGFWTISSAQVSYATFRNLILDGSGLASPATGLFDASNGANSPIFSSFTNTSFVGFPSGSRFMSSGASSYQNINLSMQETTWGNVIVTPLVRSSDPLPPITAYVVSSNRFGTRSFFADTAFGWYGWDAAGAYPTLGAVLPNGTTPWSIRVVPMTGNFLSRVNSLNLPVIEKVNTLGASQLTVTAQFCVDDSIAWTTSDVSLELVYEKVDGTIGYATTTTYIDSTALTPSTATWSSESAGKVAFYPGPILCNKYKMSLVTPVAVKDGGSVLITMRFHKYVASTSKAIFVDPDLNMAVYP